MVRTTRLQNRIVNYLKKQDKSTPEIVDYINDNWKHGTDYHAMCNILAKSGLFIKKGFAKRINATTGDKYNVVVWGVK